MAVLHKTRASTMAVIFTYKINRHYGRREHTCHHRGDFWLRTWQNIRWEIYTWRLVSLYLVFMVFIIQYVSLNCAACWTQQSEYGKWDPWRTQSSEFAYRSLIIRWTRNNMNKMSKKNLNYCYYNSMVHFEFKGIKVDTLILFFSVKN